MDLLLNIRNCLRDCLNSSAMGGKKILLCDSTYGDDNAHWAGAAGTIKLDSTGVASIVSLPTIALNQNDLEILQSYYSSTK